MKTTAFLCAALCCAALLGTSCNRANAEAGQDGRPIISTTIDFLDIAFQSRSPEGYLTLEEYEGHFKRYASAGIRRINLRTNVIGVTFYKSAYTAQYGEKGAWHYLEGAMSKRLIETLKHYDPLTETIRLGHKYGMEVWAWENVTDEGGGAPYDEKMIPPEALDDYHKTSGYPLVDPFFRAHPGCWVTAKPLDFVDIAQKNYMAQRLPIAKIVFEGYRTDRPKIRFSRDDIDLFYSFDNQHYKRYEGPMEFIPERTAEGRNILTLDGLEIRAPYVKIAPKTQYDPKTNYTLAVKGQYTAGRAYNTAGELIPTFWGLNSPPVEAVALGPRPEGFQLDSALDFATMPSVAVDHGQYQVGFFAGVFVATDHIIGVVEFCDPVAMEHKLNKFGELAKYPFDGFRLTMNCHSDGDDPDHFSYHPALRERLLEKTGKDIWRDEIPLADIVSERAAGFAEYLEGCKKLIGGRPLYISGWRPGAEEYCVHLGRTNMGTLNWPYERLIKNGTIDGVVMYDDFTDYFTDEITGGRKIHLALYRCIETGRKADILNPFEVMQATPSLNEIEYYGAVCMSDQYLQWFREFNAASAAK